MIHHILKNNIFSSNLVSEIQVWEWAWLLQANKNSKNRNCVSSGISCLTKAKLEQLRIRPWNNMLRSIIKVFCSRSMKNTTTSVYVRICTGSMLECIVIAQTWVILKPTCHAAQVHANYCNQCPCTTFFDNSLTQTGIIPIEWETFRIAIITRLILATDETE